MEPEDIPSELEHVLLSEEQIRVRLTELAAQIDADYAGKDLLLVGVLKGALMVMADLSRAMAGPVEMDWMAVSSYGAATDQRWPSPWTTTSETGARQPVPEVVDLDDRGVPVADRAGLLPRLDTLPHRERPPRRRDTGDVVRHLDRLPTLGEHVGRGVDLVVGAPVLREVLVVRDEHGVPRRPHERDLVVLHLHHGGAAQDFEQHSDAFAGDALDEAFDAAQGGVFEAHGLAGFEVAELLQSGVVAVFFKLPDALNEFVLQLSWLEAKADDGGNAFGAAHHRDALLGFAGPEQNVAREHGFKQRHRALLGFLEFFVERQIGFEGLLLEVDLGDLFLPWLGVGQIPPV